jgi:hypothetical protein
MKKLFTLLLTVVLSACSSDSDETNNNSSENILLRKAISTNQFGTITSYIYYDNNKILYEKEVETGQISETYYQHYTYQGDKIIKIERKDINNNPTGEYSLFNYTNDKLTQAIRYYDFNIQSIRNYNHLSNSLIICTVDDGTSPNDTYRLFFDSNFNMIKEEFSASHFITYTYDNYNNPAKNIVGFEALTILGGGFRNNILTESESANGHTYINNYSYQYNNQNYPVVVTDDEGYVNQYFYE